MWCAGDDFDEVFGGRAALRWWGTVLDFVGGLVFGSAFALGSGVPIDDVVHRSAVAEEYTVKGVGIGGGVPLLGLFGYNGGTKGEETVEARDATGPSLIRSHADGLVIGAVVEPCGVKEGVAPEFNAETGGIE